MGTSNETIKILFISDTHLGHPSVSPAVMCDRYRRLIFPKLKEVNLVVINGDVFDSAISLAEVFVNDVLLFLLEFLDECIENDVRIILNRGTFSHDRDQVKVFYTLSQNKNMGDKCIYSDGISLIEMLDRRFLILSDDLPYKSSTEILDAVHESLKAKNWDKVDYALTHGYFEHVVPSGVHQPKICFTAKQFSFVTRLVDSGHVHTTSTYTPKGSTVPILYNGSPDRCRHGEEEAKGCYLVTDTKGKPLKIQFLENKEATVFKEVINDVTSDKALKLWTDIFNKYKGNEVVYLKFTHPDVGIRLAVEEASRDYSNIVFTHRSPKDENKKILSTSSLELNSAKSYIPTKENFPKDILNLLQSVKRGEDLTIDLIKTYLKEL